MKRGGQSTLFDNSSSAAPISATDPLSPPPPAPHLSPPLSTHTPPQCRAQLPPRRRRRRFLGSRVWVRFLRPPRPPPPVGPEGRRLHRWQLQRHALRQRGAPGDSLQRHVRHVTRKQLSISSPARLTPRSVVACLHVTPRPCHVILTSPIDLRLTTCLTCTPRSLILCLRSPRAPHRGRR